MVAALCNLAAEFQDQAEASIGTLLSRTGYSLGQPISDEALEEYLRGNPILVNSWLIESKNTRENPAWYLNPPKTGTGWVVSYYPDNIQEKFEDKFKACAFYIRVYVLQLAAARSAEYFGRVAKFRQGE
jgi:hypothetical protein